jgi:translation initiation factor IF-3
MASSAVRAVIGSRVYFQVSSLFQSKNVSSKCIQNCSLWYHHLLRPAIHGSALYYSTEPQPPKPRAKTEPKPQITLIGIDKKVTVVLFEDAEKLAKRRDLKLVKVSDFDTKSQRPLYRLDLQAASDINKTTGNKIKTVTGGIKKEKQVSFSPKISPHDIESRMKQISKWIQKNLEVRVTINGSAGDSALMVCIICKL